MRKIFPGADLERTAPSFLTLSTPVQMAGVWADKFWTFPMSGLQDPPWEDNIGLGAGQREAMRFFQAAELRYQLL